MTQFPQVKNTTESLKIQIEVFNYHLYCTELLELRDFVHRLAKGMGMVVPLFPSPFLCLLKAASQSTRPRFIFHLWVKSSWKKTSRRIIFCPKHTVTKVISSFYVSPVASICYDLTAVLTRMRFPVDLARGFGMAVHEWILTMRLHRAPWQLTTGRWRSAFEVSSDPINDCHMA